MHVKVLFKKLEKGIIVVFKVTFKILSFKTALLFYYNGILLVLDDPLGSLQLTLIAYTKVSERTH